MKFQSYIIVRCIAPNNINEKELLTKIEQSICKQFPNLSIASTTSTLYCKDPESTSIIYSFWNYQNIKVADFIKVFPLSWEYSEGYVYNIDIQQRVDNEDAVWSQLCNPEEVFLNSTVDWLHIYTLEMAENAIVN